MAFIPKEWKCGDVVYAEDLNKLEQEMKSVSDRSRALVANGGTLMEIIQPFTFREVFNTYMGSGTFNIVDEDDNPITDFDIVSFSYGMTAAQSPDSHIYQTEGMTVSSDSNSTGFIVKQTDPSALLNTFEARLVISIPNNGSSGSSSVLELVAGETYDVNALLQSSQLMFYKVGSYWYTVTRITESSESGVSYTVSSLPERNGVYFDSTGVFVTGLQ